MSDATLRLPVVFRATGLEPFVSCNHCGAIVGRDRCVLHTDWHISQEEVVAEEPTAVPLRPATSADIARARKLAAKHGWLDDEPARPRSVEEEP